MKKKNLSTLTIYSELKWRVGTEVFVCGANKAPSGGSIAKKTVVSYRLNKMDEEEAAAAQ